MRKLAAYGAAALLAVSALAGGVSYAQDTTTPTPVTASAVAQQVAAQRTWLGVSVQDDAAGVTVTQVSAGSPAETAQLQAGDVILAVNGTTVSTVSDLSKIIDAASAGDKVTLTIERSSAQISVDVTLGSHTDRARGMLSDPLQAAEFMLHAQLTAVDGGYQVVSVGDINANNNSTSDSANANPFNLAVGDVITEVNGTAITSVDWRTLFAPPSTTTANAGNTVTLTVQRSGADVTLQGTLTMFGGPRGQRGGFGGHDQPNGNNGRQGGFPGGQPNGNNGQPGGAPPNGGQPGGFV